MEAVQSVLGEETRKHPDCFREKAASLFLSTKRESDRRAFATFCKVVKSEMRKQRMTGSKIKPCEHKVEGLVERYFGGASETSREGERD